jgi:SM-20-related protein
MENNSIYPNNIASFEGLVNQMATQDFGCIENFLSEQEVGVIRQLMEDDYAHNRLKKAGIGQGEDHQVNRQIRGDYIRWIDPQKARPPVKALLVRVFDLMHYINRTCYLSLKDLETHFAVYPEGTFYRRHLDQFRADDHRKLSFICYLNPEWQPEAGGQLRLYLPLTSGGEEVVDIAPTAGKLVCFKSDVLEHEVLPTRQERWSITGWMLTQPLSLTFLP